MAPRARTPTTTPDDLSLLTGNHMMEDENHLPQDVCDLRTQDYTQTHSVNKTEMNPGIMPPGSIFVLCTP